MKVVLQRVRQASCCPGGQIGPGLVLLVGIGPQDDESLVAWMAKKIVSCRVFSDSFGKMNLSITQVKGEILSVSQFTLYGQWKKGNRPSFSSGAPFEQAQRLYDYFNQQLAQYVPVQTGVFGADMQVSLINDGPVTLIMEEENENCR